MQRVLKIKEQLEIVCVYGQANYAKAMEIQLKERRKFFFALFDDGDFSCSTYELGCHWCTV